MSVKDLLERNRMWQAYTAAARAHTESMQHAIDAQLRGAEGDREAAVRALRDALGHLAHAIDQAKALEVSIDAELRWLDMLAATAWHLRDKGFPGAGELLLEARATRERLRLAGALH